MNYCKEAWFKFISFCVKRFLWRLNWQCGFCGYKSHTFHIDESDLLFEKEIRKGCPRCGLYVTKVIWYSEKAT